MAAAARYTLALRWKGNATHCSVGHCQPTVAPVCAPPPGSMPVETLAMHQHPAKSTSAHVGHVPPINGQAVVHPLRRRIRQLLDRHRPQRLALAVKVLLRQRWWTRRRLLHETQQAQTDTAVRIRQACNPLLATRTLPLAAPPPALVCLRRGGWGGRCIVGPSTTLAGPRQEQGRPKRATHEGIKPAPLNWLAPASKPPPPYMLLAIGAVGGLPGRGLQGVLNWAARQGRRSLLLRT